MGVDHAPPFGPLRVAEPLPWAMRVARHPHSGQMGWHPLWPMGVAIATPFFIFFLKKNSLFIFKKKKNKGI